MSNDESAKQFTKDVQAWLQKSKEALRPDTVGQSMITELEEWILSGSLNIEASNEYYFSLIEDNYPISVNRIDWSKVNNHRVIGFRSSTASDIHVDVLREKLWNARSTLHSWFKELGISEDDHVIFIGDDSEMALKMQIKVFMECFPVLLEQPQHGYLIPEDGRWCLNYTMESELFLGVASNAVTSGWMDE